MIELRNIDRLVILTNDRTGIIFHHFYPVKLYFHFTGAIRLNKKMAAKNTVILSEAWALRAGGQ